MTLHKSVELPLQSSELLVAGTPQWDADGLVKCKSLGFSEVLTDSSNTKSLRKFPLSMGQNDINSILEKVELVE